MGQCTSQNNEIPELEMDLSSSEELEMEDPTETEEKDEQKKRELFLGQMQIALREEPKIRDDLEKIFNDHSTQSISDWSFACKGAALLRHHENLLEAFAFLIPSGINLEISFGGIEISEEKAEGKREILNRLFNG